MKIFNCLIKDFEPFGLFVGASLALKNESDLRELRKIKSSVEFYNEISEQLEKFLETNEFNIENLEIWFGKFFGFMKYCKVRPSVTREPKDYLNTLWFEIITDKKNKFVESEVNLLIDPSPEFIKSGFKDLINVRDLANAFYFYGIH